MLSFSSGSEEKLRRHDEKQEGRAGRGRERETIKLMEERDMKTIELMKEKMELPLRLS